MGPVTPTGSLTRFHFRCRVWAAARELLVFDLYPGALKERRSMRRRDITDFL
ncbi:MAG: hypothetical protein HY726_15295 [Candidatus Rokubacteria bacterium]|nr:hypothetical protein [Candidatus Rokubacteria bacterium]